MRKNLYIDFDGVIADTMPALAHFLEKNGLAVNSGQKFTQKQQRFARELIASYDFNNILKETAIIADAFLHIDNLIKCGKYRVYILTHICSLSEADSKVRFIRKYHSEITIIPVPKHIPKHKMVSTKDSILVDDYSGNLRLWQLNGGKSILFGENKKQHNFENITNLGELLDWEF